MWPFRYPYSNFHELNLDWILERVKEMSDKLESFNDYLPRFAQVNNSIWSEEHSYKPNEMVVVNDSIYIARTFVPAGTSVGDERFWLRVATITIDAEELLEQVKKALWYVTPEDFGAAHDGVTDDGAAFAAALNSGYPVKLIRTDKRYTIKSPVIVGKSAAVLTGAAEWNETGTGTGSGINLSENGRFEINNSLFHADNIYIYTYSQTSNTPVFVLNGDGLDVDAEFFNCCFSEGFNAIRCNGRGLRVENCTFARVPNCIDLNFIGTTDADDPITESKVTGGRAFEIRDNRFHSGCTYAVRIIEGSSVAEMLYTGNNSDHYGAGVAVYGTARHLTITNNIFANCVYRPFAVVGTVDGLVFTENVLTSRDVAGSGLAQCLFEVVASGTLNNATITNNLFDGSGYQAIVFRNAVAAYLNISNNEFRNINLTGDNRAYGVVDVPLDTKNFVCTGNIFVSAAPTAAGACISCVGGAANTMQRWIVQNNMKCQNKDWLVHPDIMNVIVDSLVQTYRNTPT